MISYNCPSCDKTIHSPESEVGQRIDCPHCNTSVRVPAGGKSNTGLIIGIVALNIFLVGCPLLIIVCLAAISVLGKSASAAFQSVGNSIGGS